MPPRAVPSSLVITSPVTPAVCWKASTWLSAFWPTVASSTSSAACGRLRIELADDADHLGELVHQPGLVLQAPGGVDQQHVGAGGLRLLQRLEGEARGIRTLLAGDDLRAGALAPDLELLDRRGAEGVAGRQHHRFALRPELGRELADRRGLARAIDADHQDHERLFRGVDHQRLRHRRQDRLDLARQDRLHLGGLDLLVVAALADGLGDAGGGGEAEIGLDQDVLEILQRRRRRACAW